MKRNLRMTVVLAVAALSAACSKSSDVNDEESDGVNADGGGTTLDAASGAGPDAGSGAASDAGAAMDGSTRNDGGGQRPIQECPATVPTNGSPCVSGRGDCTIGSTFCDCPRDTQQWICWDPADCPAVAPAQGAACTLVGMACDIGAATLNDDGVECECTGRGWECEGADEDDEEDAGIDAGTPDAGATDAAVDGAIDAASDGGHDAAG